MPALVAGIHVLLPWAKKDVDGRDRPGHDGCDVGANEHGGRLHFFF